jgi:hypothetical protein
MRAEFRFPETLRQALDERTAEFEKHELCATPLACSNRDRRVHQNSKVNSIAVKQPSSEFARRPGRQEITPRGVMAAGN